MKVFFATLATETNTYSPTPTGMGAYTERGIYRPGDAVVPLSLRGLFDHAKGLAVSTGQEVAFGLSAGAQPLGVTLRAVYESLRDELLAHLRAAMPVQAVILPLHGAMVAEGYDDCEGDLISRVRAIVGPQVAIGVELDLHCHFTETMRREADIIIAYKEYPHTDVLARLSELWRLALATAAGRIRPATAVFDCRMVGIWHTTREPLRSFVARMQSLEGRDGVLSISLGHGFPYADVPEAGAKLWVVSDNNLPLAARLAEQLGREFWALRAETTAQALGLAEAVAAVEAAPPGRPLLLADVADNAGLGAASDSTFVLRALRERGVGNVAIGPIWDLGAVQICCDAGVGAQLTLRVGGKCGPASGDPLDLVVTVLAVAAQHSQDMLGVTRLDCGVSVWVQTEDGSDLVLVSKRVQAYGTDLFTGLGVDLAAKRVIVVKSTQHFHAAFAPLAQQVLYVQTPGLGRSDYENIPYQRRDLNFWPRVADPWAACT